MSRESLMIARMQNEGVEKCGVGVSQTVGAAARSYEDGFAPEQEN
jgi:hypothetical protein